MSEVEFRMFSELFREHCGLHFSADNRFLLEKRLARRLKALAIPSFAAYHHLLRKDVAGDQELSLLVDELTTNETFFFRELNQLTALIEEVIPECMERRRNGFGGPVSIWSAGCSSGEEPYSVAMLALEAGLVPGRDIRIYASDFSRAILQKARRGVYRPASFRQTPDDLRRRYFTEADGLTRIIDDVKHHVVFTHLNVIDPSRVALLGTLDIILCRNLIIYFDAETKRRVIQTFHDSIRPGGYLLLGHSESLINLSSSFELCHLRKDLVYRRPDQGERTVDRWQRAEVAALEKELEESGS